MYLQKKAEEQLLVEQHQYQTTLRQASMGMGQIKELARLLKLIVHIVTRAVFIEHCEIYFFHEDSTRFTLKASRGWPLIGRDQISIIDSNSTLVKYLEEVKESIVFEEIEQYAKDYGGKKLRDIEDIARKLDGALIVPSFMDQKLIAILVLGKKKSGKLYTQDDIAVFSILANQAGLAIENAQFYEKMKETHKQLLKVEKMATIGTMADGLSHQLNNRLHAMGFIAGDALDTLKLKKKEDLPSDMRELLDDIEYSLKRIEDNVKCGGEIVEGLLKYTRKGSEGFEAIQLNDLLDASFEMAQYKIKIKAMRINRRFDDSLPKIKGNFTQLQEVFFNLIDNAYDAMMQRKEELSEPGYQPNLEISAVALNGKLQILVQDNGIGVKKEDMDKMFTPFFTTKLSSKKGTGLGLYVIRQIIEENHEGKVRFTSKYRQGSQTSILLPVAN
jgi:signal transduction histidine kinase